MFHGSMVALVTPMTENGQVDFEVFRALLDWHITQGTDAIIVAGTTGESATLTAKEWHEAITVAIQHINDRLPVIVGSGATSTHKSIELTKAAMEAGADACLLMSPPYVKPTQEGLFQHYQAIAKEVAIPQILYNVPGRTCSDIEAETVGRLSTIPNIVAIKEAGGDPKRTKTIVDNWGDRIDVYSGDDATAKESMFLGAKGVISVTANVAPAAMHALCDAATKGNTKEANAIDARLQPLHKNLFVESNPIPVKWALAELGLIPKGIRLPLTVLAKEHEAIVRESLEQAGLL